jgi:hypothetical protein
MEPQEVVGQDEAVDGGFVADPMMIIWCEYRRGRDEHFTSFDGKPHVEISIEMILFRPRQVPRRYRIRVAPDVSRRAAAQIFQG